MERVLLNVIGGSSRKLTCQPMSSADLDAWTLHVQSQSIEKSTASCYATGARDYLNFCSSHNLPIDPTPQTLSKYIAFTSKFIASGSKYLSGAGYFLRNIYPDFDSNRAHPLVTSAIKGAKKIRADPIHHKLPLRLSHLSSFVTRARTSNDYDDLLFATLMSCAFYACHRSGELVIKTKALLDWRKIVKRSSLRFSNGYASYDLPYHKTDRFFTGSQVMFAHHDVADPVKLLYQYTSRRDAIHGARFVLFLRHDGSLPTRAWFDSKLSSFLDKSYGGHSPRAGGATFYASLGLSEDVIMAIGRWTSQAWKTYLRDNPSVQAELQLAFLNRKHNISVAHTCRSHTRPRGRSHRVW